RRRDRDDQPAHGVADATERAPGLAGWLHAPPSTGGPATSRRVPTTTVTVVATTRGPGRAAGPSTAHRPTRGRRPTLGAVAAAQSLEGSPWAAFGWSRRQYALVLTSSPL